MCINNPTQNVPSENRDNERGTDIRMWNGDNQQLKTYLLTNMVILFPKRYSKHVATGCANLPYKKKMYKESKC